MSVSEMRTMPAGTVVKINRDYLDWLSRHLGPGAWLPGPDDLGVTLLSYGNSTVVALVDGGPGFTIMHDGNVMGALVVPTNELSITADNYRPVSSEVLQPAKVHSAFTDWGGATAAISSLYLMGMKPGQIAKKVGVSRQYVHISAERITSELYRRGYKVSRR